MTVLRLHVSLECGVLKRIHIRVDYESVYKRDYYVENLSFETNPEKGIEIRPHLIVSLLKD